MAKKVTTAKKSVKSNRRPAKNDAVSLAQPAVPNLDNPVMSAPATKQIFSPKVLRYGLVIVLIALLTYKFGPWLFPARVGNRLVSRFEIWNKLEKAYGAQTLDDIVNEQVLDQVIAKSGIKPDQAAVDAELQNLESQYASLGGLDEALKQNGLTRADLEKQIKTQLTVEQILADQIVTTPSEIEEEYEANKDTLYAEKSLEEVSESIKKNLEDSKLRDAFLTWFAEVKKDITITNFGL